MKRFLLILTTVTGLCYFYVLQSLDPGYILGGLLFFPFFLIWLLPVLFWGKGEKKDSAFSHVVHYAGYLSMAFISFLFFYLVAADLVGLVTSVPWKTSVVLGLAAGSLFLGHFIARKGPTVLPVSIPLVNLPPELEGLRIAHITDLHIGLTIRKNYVSQVVEKTLKENPDLIVLTGDIADGDLQKYGDDAEPLRLLGNTGKTWLVPGNHDYYSSWPAWKKHFLGLGIKILENQHAKFDHLLLGGVTDPAARVYGEAYGPDPVKAMDPDSKLFKILLAHNPKLAVPAAQAGFDLMLSGHTHAGQFFPWTFVVKFVHRPHFGGLSDEGKMKVYVGPGTGTWGPPVRLGTTPEITLITLRGADSSE